MPEIPKLPRETLRRGWEVALTVLLAILLGVAAEARHPYSFYIMQRMEATVGGIYWAVRVYRVGPRGWMWAFVAMALLFNPILPVRMQRPQWESVDTWLSFLLLGWSFYWGRRKAGGLHP